MTILPYSWLEIIAGFIFGKGQTRRIPESEWQWYGNALHCVVANRCRFHMATKVGDYIASLQKD